MSHIAMRAFLIVGIVSVALLTVVQGLHIPFDDDDDEYERKICNNELKDLSHSIKFIAWTILSSVLMYPIVSVCKALLWKSMVASLKASAAKMSSPEMVLSAIV